MAKAERSPLQKHIERLIAEHGGVRATARALGVDGAYLCRMRHGVLRNPTEKTLKKLGLQREERYRPIGG